MVGFNLNRGTEYVRLFEAGDIYEAIGSRSAEHARLCFAATASALRHDLPQGGVMDKSQGESGLDIFRSFKGEVETVLNAFEHSTLQFDQKTSEYYHAGRSARILLNGVPVAQFGVLHPEITAQRKLRQETYVAEIDTEELYEHPLRAIRYQPLPKYPAVERDLSFVFADPIVFGQIEKAVYTLDLPEMRSFSPAEIFRGGAIPKGSYSILLRAKFQSYERTLREDEVNEWSRRIVAALTSLGGRQRA
jgi:phenylalanyl-tRNA synthetase beta chain